MSLYLLIIIFVISSIILYFSSEAVINGLTSMSKFLGVTEFILSFFIIAFAASIPNLIVGITAATKGVPELSFGDVMGNNIVALTIGIGLATLFSKKKEIKIKNKTIGGTTIFTFFSAILPLTLMYDGVLSRTDGLVLISFFFLYLFWLFSKKERFSKKYDEDEDVNLPENDFVGSTKNFFRDLLKILVGFIFILIAAHGIVYAAELLAIRLNVPNVLIGILILGLGSALPEVYFAISSARKGEEGVILGNLMGSVIIPASLILGIVSMVRPIDVSGLEFFAINRLFVILATTFFFIFVKTNSKITKREAYLLISVYLLFLFITIFVSQM